ncbi:MAG: hypothetical protein JWQ76_810 [Ramlibacter sp.]|nr:hypothetical protein [Ramlibacter sp.]
MPASLRSGLAPRAALLALLLAAGAAALAAGSGEAPFLAENHAAMTRMMAGMTVKPSGDVDADFVAMMVSHHQGAIDMAEAELRYGRNARLLRIARDIIAKQQQQIVEMRTALGQPHPPKGPN